MQKNTEYFCFARIFLDCVNGVLSRPCKRSVKVPFSVATTIDRNGGRKRANIDGIPEKRKQKKSKVESGRKKEEI